MGGATTWTVDSKGCVILSSEEEEEEEEEVQGELL